MALNNKHKVWESLIKKTLLIGAVAAVIVFNVCKFLQYAETNDRFVKNYASKQDALAYYRNPLPAVFYFAGSQKYHKAYPLMAAIPCDDARFSNKVAADLKSRLGKYKNITQTTIITAQSSYQSAEKLKQYMFDKADIVTFDDKLQIDTIKDIAEGLIKPDSLLIWVEDVNLKNETKAFKAMEMLADKLKLRPYVINLTSRIPVSVLAENEPNISDTLDKQYTSLEQFKSDYGKQLSDLISDKLQNKAKVPQYSAITEHLFDKGNILVTVALDNGNYVDFGSVFEHNAVGRSLFNNMEKAQKNYPHLPYRYFLATGVVKRNYATEQELLDDLIMGQDGVIITRGYRRAMFLPYRWNMYPQKEEFIKQLKLEAGLAPDYWSEKIKVYIFRTVEIVDEN